MNTLMLVVLAVVLLCYCGGRFCPKVLSSNKEVVLGVLVGMVLCSFAGLKLEGLMVPDCEKILDTMGGDHIESSFAPPTCRGYRRGGEPVDTTSDSGWCNNQTNPSDYCIDRVQIDETPRECCDDAGATGCMEFLSRANDSNLTLMDIANWCQNNSPTTNNPPTR